MQSFRNATAASFGVPGFSTPKNAMSLSQKWRKLEASIVRALTLPTWWEYL